jgi:hypothetical protein
VNRSTGLVCDQTIALNGFCATKHYPGHLRRIRYRDPESGKTLVFLTNHFALPALTICELGVFKWIQQHLRIKRFYGTSENAVRTQIWIAIRVYVLVRSSKRNFAWTGFAAVHRMRHRWLWPVPAQSRSSS